MCRGTSTLHLDSRYSQLPGLVELMVGRSLFLYLWVSNLQDMFTLANSNGPAVRWLHVRAQTVGSTLQRSDSTAIGCCQVGACEGATLIVGILSYNRQKKLNVSLTSLPYFAGVSPTRQQHQQSAHRPSPFGNHDRNDCLSSPTILSIGPMRLLNPISTPEATTMRRRPGAV